MEEPAKTESGEIRMHRIDGLEVMTKDLDAAVKEIKQTFNENRNLTALSIQVVHDRVKLTDEKIADQNGLLVKVASKLSVLNWALTLLFLIGLVFSVILVLAVAIHIKENKDKIEQLERETKAEQVHEDDRNRP